MKNQDQQDQRLRKLRAKAKADLALFMAPCVARMKETQAFHKRLQEMGILASYTAQDDDNQKEIADAQI